MSKKTARQQPRPVNRRHASRREREANQSRMLKIGAGTVLALTVLVLGWGLFQQYVLRPRTPVATVGESAIRLDTYQKLVNYRRWDYGNYLQDLESQKATYAADENQAWMVQFLDQQISQVRSELMNLPESVVDDLIDDQITRQECEIRGIAVTPEDVEIRLEEQFGYERNPPTPTPTPITATLPITVTPTPTMAPMTLEDYQQRLASWTALAKAQAGFSEADFGNLLESSLYREKLVEVLEAEVPTTAEQVRARHILVETREEAESVLARLLEGEAFEDLAAELSTDVSNKDSGGDLGWFMRGDMVAAFDEVAFSSEPGQLSDVVETDFGFHIIRVEEHESDRELEPDALTRAKSKAVEDWYAARRVAPSVVRLWEPNMEPTPISTRVFGR